MVKKIISIFFTFFLCISNVIAIPVKITSDKYILYNLNDDRILEEKLSHDETQIASLTKIMTTIVAIENIDDFDKKVTIKKEMLNGLTRDIAQMGFKVGEQYTYNDLLYSTMLPSAADAANALAVSIGGSIKEFLVLMNNKARELNLQNTHYSNSFGLTDKDNYSSAYDISLLLKYALQNEKFKSIFTAKEYKLTNNKVVKSTVYKFKSPYIIGSKTGYTSKAGRCLASIANVNDVDLMLVTLNNYNKNLNYITETNDVYKYYEDNYSYKNVIDENDIITKIGTIDSKEKEYDVKVDKEYTYYLSNDFNKEDLIYEYEGTTHVSSLDRKNKKIGVVKVKYNDEIIKEIDLFYDGSLNISNQALHLYLSYISIAIMFICLLVYTKHIKRKGI